MSGSRLYDRSFALAFISQTCFVLANTLTAHYARWIEFLGGDVVQVGWIMGSAPIISLLARPVLGHWINVLGARASWALGYVLFGLGAIGNIWLAELGWSLYVLRCLLALGAAFVFAASLTYVTQAAPVARRTEAIGVLGAGGFLGMLLGPWLGDKILGAADREFGDFQILFGSATFALIIPLLLLIFLKPVSPPKPTVRMPLWEFVPTVRRYWPGPILWVNVIFGVCMTVPFAFLASYVDSEKLMMENGSTIGLFFLGYAGWGLTLRVGSRRLPDRVGRRKVLLVGLVAMGLSMFCYPLVSESRPWLIIIPGLVGGTGHALVFHTMTALALQRFPSAVRGTGSALSLMMLDVGFIAGAPLLGQITKIFGYDTMFATIGSLCLLTTVAYFVCSEPDAGEVSEKVDERPHPAAASPTEPFEAEPVEEATSC